MTYCRRGEVVKTECRQRLPLVLSSDVLSCFVLSRAAFSCVVISSCAGSSCVVFSSCCVGLCMLPFLCLASSYCLCLVLSCVVLSCVGLCCFVLSMSFRWKCFGGNVENPVRFSQYDFLFNFPFSTHLHVVERDYFFLRIPNSP